MDVQTAVETAIYNSLSQNQNIIALVGRNPTNATVQYQIYNTQAPIESPYPLIVFYELDGNYNTKAPSRAYDFMYRIVCWAYNKSESRKLLGYVYDTLDRKQFSVAEYQLYQVLGKKPTSTLTNVEGNQVYGAVGVYEILVK